MKTLQSLQAQLSNTTLVSFTKNGWYKLQESAKKIRGIKKVLEFDANFASSASVNPSTRATSKLQQLQQRTSHNAVERLINGFTTIATPSPIDPRFVILDKNQMTFSYYENSEDGHLTVVTGHGKEKLQNLISAFKFMNKAARSHAMNGLGALREQFPSIMDADWALYVQHLVQQFDAADAKLEQVEASIG